MYTFHNPIYRERLGEYFADYDEESGTCCVFHTDNNSGHAYSSWASMEQAEEEAERLNNL